jgi:hypothetical protein
MYGTADLIRAIDNGLFHEGRRLAQGPWEMLRNGRWGVPSCGYVTRCLLGDCVMALERKRWVVERVRKDKSGNHEIDPVWRRG